MGGEGFTSGQDAAVYVWHFGGRAAIVDAGCGDHTDRLDANIRACGIERQNRDTLLHYLIGIAWFVVIDDGKGVQACRRHDIPHVNALLFPRLLHYTGHLSAQNSRHFFDQIQTLGHYSASVVNWAASCTKADLDFFIAGR